MEQAPQPMAPTMDSPDSLHSLHSLHSLATRLRTFRNGAGRLGRRLLTSRTFVAGLTFLFVFGMPVIAWAAAAEDDETIDGRLEGYNTIAIDRGGTGMIYLLLLLLAVVGLAALFKNANRSHLD